MPRPCSLDLRMRELREVEAGASRREAAECVEVSASSAIKWMQRLKETGSIAAKPSGGSISPLEAHAAVLLGLIAEQADLTLDEIGLRRRAMVAPFVLDGPMNATSFMAYLKQCLAPTLKRGDIVMMDSLPVHKVAGVREVIEAAGARLRYLQSDRAGV